MLLEHSALQPGKIDYTRFANSVGIFPMKFSRSFGICARIYVNIIALRATARRMDRRTCMLKVTHILCFLEQEGVSAFSGAENHLFMLMDGQKKAGLDVELVMISYGLGAELMDKKSELERSGIPVHNFRLKATGGKAMHHASEARLIFELAGFLKSRRGRVIHAHMDVAGRVGRIAARMAGCGAVVQSFHNDSPYFASPRWRFELGLLDKFTRRTIAISDAVRDHLINNAGLPAEKIVTVHYGVPPPETSRDRNLIRDELGIPRDAFVAGFVGRLHEQKDIPTLIAALEKLPHVTGVIIGGGELESSLRALVAKMGLSNVLFLGYRADAVEIMPSFDVFCLTSRWEGLGLVLIEAMLRGVPIIGSRAGAIPEILGNGKFGALFDTGDSARLAELIESTRNNPESTAQTALAARAHAIKAFTVEAMVEKTTEVYSKSIQGKT